MEEYFCVHCGASILAESEDDLAQCPSCGQDPRQRQTAPSPAPRKAKVADAGDAKKSPRTVAILVSFAAALAIAGILFFIFIVLPGWRLDWEYEEKAAQEKAAEQAAIEAARDWVRDQLVAPRTAEFYEEFAFETEDKSWSVMGKVSSQNRFGAFLEAKYVATARKGQRMSGDIWEVEGVLITDE